MIHERTLRVLEYPKVCDLLARETLTVMGRERAAALLPAAEVAECRARQQETTEVVALRAVGEVPLRGTRDLRPLVRRATADGVLDPQDLLDVAQTLQVARRLKGFLEAHRDRAPRLAAVAGRIIPLESLEGAIATVLDEEGQVRDDASATLRRVRTEQRTLDRRIRAAVEGVLRNPAYSQMLQESLITVRGDRFVVPIRQEAKGQFPGIVHDQSSSGATVFMEPLSIVPLGNRRRELAATEREEIHRLLLALSRAVAAEAEAIGAILEALGVVDLALAKASLSERFGCSEPALTETGALLLRAARHPVLLLHQDPERVVPIDVELGGRFQMLVITGPNTGGKTVTLKTIGLLTLMAQAGLHVPAAEGSTIRIFPQIFADIGDEQSIEQNLSTFSSHLTAIVEILAHLQPPALVLLDEVAAGTDPTEGAALARAIIETLQTRGVWAAVTTHYNELKALAYLLEGVENASVEFNPETLQPTFRVLIGQPGQSNAFIIGERLGLQREITERARSFLSAERLRADELLRDLASDRQIAAREREEAERLRREARTLADHYHAEVNRLEAERRRLVAGARQEAEEWLARTRRDLEAILHEVRSARSDEAAHAARRRLTQLAAEWEERAAEGLASGSTGSPLDAVEVGQTVHVPGLGRTGRVVTPPDGRGEVEVEVGAVRTRLPLKALRAAASPEASGPVDRAPPHGMLQAVPASLSLRGQTVDEALVAVDAYLDDATVAQLPRVTLIHGKGTGALRRAIQEFLRSHPHVRTFRLGDRTEGGEGVTVVELNV